MTDPRAEARAEAEWLLERGTPRDWAAAPRLLRELLAEVAAIRAERDRLRAALTRIVEFDSAANYERLGKLMVHFTEEQEAYCAVKGIAEAALTASGKDTQ